MNLPIPSPSVATLTLHSASPPQIHTSSKPSIKLFILGILKRGSIFLSSYQTDTNTTLGEKTIKTGTWNRFSDLLQPEGSNHLGARAMGALADRAPHCRTRQLCLPGARVWRHPAEPPGPTKLPCPLIWRDQDHLPEVPSQLS